MSKTSLYLALAGLLVLSGSAFADNFQFSSPGSVTWNGVYVNPYSATVDQAGGTFASGTVLTIYCDDWNTDFSGNPTWNATVYALTLGNTTNFKYGKTTPDFNVTLDTAHNTLGITSDPVTIPAGSFNRYLEAAWLDEQWLDAVTQGTATADMQKKLAAAVWTLFVDATHVNDPNGGLIGAINSSGYATDVYNYLQEAQTEVTTGGYLAAGWDVIVPVGNNSNGGPMQEFLVHTPEPSAVILLGTVVGVLGLTKFRRKRQA